MRVQGLRIVRMKTHASFTREKICNENAVQFVSDPRCGAVATFLGVTRSDIVNGNLVGELDFESHEPLALAVLDTIVRDYRTEDPELQHVYIEHRLGRVCVGETNIILAVSAKHRKCAFRAVETLMDRIKAQVPVWKKEIYTDLTYRWIENSEFSRNTS
jgi:molybdopterin synthase catalytic subunit